MIRCGDSGIYKCESPVDSWLKESGVQHSDQS